MQSFEHGAESAMANRVAEQHLHRCRNHRPVIVASCYSGCTNVKPTGTTSRALSPRGGQASRARTGSQLDPSTVRRSWGQGRQRAAAGRSVGDAPLRWRAHADAVGVRRWRVDDHNAALARRRPGLISRGLASPSADGCDSPPKSDSERGAQRGYDRSGESNKSLYISYLYYLNSGSTS